MKDESEDYVWHCIPATWEDLNTRAAICFVKANDCYIAGTIFDGFCFGTKFEEAEYLDVIMDSITELNSWLFELTLTWLIKPLPKSPMISVIEEQADKLLEQQKLIESKEKKIRELESLLNVVW